jgi:hypothetical protein
MMVQIQPLSTDIDIPGDFMVVGAGVELSWIWEAVAGTATTA